MSTTELTAPPEQADDKISRWIQREDQHAQIAAAVGNVMDANQFIAHMVTALANPDFANCTWYSKCQVVMECAAMGLLPTLKQVALIPRDKKDSNRVIAVELTAMPQWQGYKALMERHPSILEVQAELVHKDDQFQFLNGEVRHTYNPFDEKRKIEKPGDIRGGYCKIIYRDGRVPRYHIVTAKKIIKAMNCAQTQKVWNAWFEEQALKTLYRNCYARQAVPIDPLVYQRLEAVVKADDVFLGNDPVRITEQPPPVGGGGGGQAAVGALADKVNGKAASAADDDSDAPPVPEREPGDEHPEAATTVTVNETEQYFMRGIQTVTTVNGALMLLQELNAKKKKLGDTAHAALTAQCQTRIAEIKAGGKK